MISSSLVQLLSDISIKERTDVSVEPILIRLSLIVLLLTLGFRIDIVGNGSLGVR